MGVVIAGEFTGGAITQLKSLGFNVLYFSYATIVQAFKKFGIDASFDEDTPTTDFDDKIKQWEGFIQKDKLARYLFRLNKSEVDLFFENLEKCVSRYINSVQVIALHGQPFTATTINQAIDYIENYTSSGEKDEPVLKYEITIKYNNGDKIEGTFVSKKETLEFLNSYSSPVAKRK